MSAARFAMALALAGTVACKYERSASRAEPTLHRIMVDDARVAQLGEDLEPVDRPGGVDEHGVHVATLGVTTGDARIVAASEPTPDPVGETVIAPTTVQLACERAVEHEVPPVDEAPPSQALYADADSNGHLVWIEQPMKQ